MNIIDEVIVPPDFLELMKLYAQRGIRDWNSAPSELQKRARDCLGMGIAENPYEANIAIHKSFKELNSSQLLFIPMPYHPPKGIERSFFLPIREMIPGGDYTLALELFVLVSARNCLAFRFEPAAAGSAHNYGHMQLTKQLARKAVKATTIPDWLPVKYPAFPTQTSQPLETFLCMITAVHGYQGGSVAVLEDIFQRASRISELRFYLDQLQKILV